MNKKLLTISVSAYNVEKYLEQTLESLIIKNIEEIEVLIINDGSKDATLEIAKKYENMYPQTFIVIDKPNGGYGTTIKKGLELASGKYFMVLDGDDWLNKKALESLVESIRTHNEDIIFWNMIYVYEDGRLRKDNLFAELVPQRTYRWDDVNNIFNVQIHSLIVNTELYNSIEYPISDYFYVDIEFIVFCILVAETFSFVDVDLYMYRFGQAEQSVNKKSMQKNYSMLEAIALRVCEIYEKNSLDQNKNKREFLLKRISNVVYATFTVALSFKPNAENKDRLFNYLKKMNVADVEEKLMKTKKLFVICKKCPWLYPIVARVYRALTIK